MSELQTLLTATAVSFLLVSVLAAIADAAEAPA
jgi:hypothetical protein